MLSITKRVRRMLLCALTPLAFASCSALNSEPEPLELLNFRYLEGRVVGGGQVDVNRFPAMASSGYTLVVNTRRTGEEFPENEAELAQAAGLAYIHMPMGGDDLVTDHARRLAAALEAHPDGHVLIHCKSGNRVGALWGLHVALRDELTVDEAIVAAKNAGMRSESLANCVKAALTE